MDEARTVLARLERIERLQAAGAPARQLLDEVRRLLEEAESWLRAERGPTGEAREALARCRDALGKAESRAGAGAGLW